MASQPNINVVPGVFYKTTLSITVRDALTNKELFSDAEHPDNAIEGIAVIDKEHGAVADIKIMRPDIPRSKKYWKAAFRELVPKIRLYIYGGKVYKDLIIDLALDTRRRITTVLVVVERRS